MIIILEPYEICNKEDCKYRFGQQIIGMPDECLGMNKDRGTKFTCEISEGELVFHGGKE